MLLFVHGVPASAGEGAPYHSVAAASDVTVLAFDRPGMGDSDYDPRQSIASVAADALQLLDGLGVRRCAVAGESGGGPYAAAIAALLGGRCASLQLVAAVGPLAPGPLARSIGGFDRTVLRLLRWRMRPVAAMLLRLMAYLAKVRPCRGLQASAAQEGSLFLRAWACIVMLVPSAYLGQTYTHTPGCTYSIPNHQNNPQMVKREAAKDLGPADGGLLAERPEVGDMLVQVRGWSWQCREPVPPLSLTRVALRAAACLRMPVLQDSPACSAVHPQRLQAERTGRH